jgi:hypothetical protein
MNVLNETNVHVRMQHGHILNLFITMVNKMKISPELQGPEKHVSSIGGFTLSDLYFGRRSISLPADLHPTRIFAFKTHLPLLPQEIFKITFT